MKAAGALKEAPRARALAAILIAAAAMPAAAGAAAPAWLVDVTAMPSNFAPGAHGSLTSGPRYSISATNVGDAAAAGPIVVTDTLPAGLTPGMLDASKDCSAAGQLLTCTISETIYPSGRFELAFGVNVGIIEDPKVLEPNEVTISSPGAVSRTATTTTTVSAEAAPFGFDGGLSGLGAWLTEADGEPIAVAGSRPGQLTVNVGFRTKPGTPVLTSGGGAHEVRTYLPPGLIFDPTATPVRCTEAQFLTATCSDAAAIGRASSAFGFIGTALSSDPLYNLVPPPGAVASFGFDPTNTGLHVHVIGGLRPGDYALSGALEDLPALFERPLYGAQLQLWGDPSSSSHDHLRGACIGSLTCPVPSRDFAALSAPTSCGRPLAIEAEIDSWAEPGKFLPKGTPVTDLEGNPAGVSGCTGVPFEPTLRSQPTTNLSDSPTGLDVDLHVPQNASLEVTATAHLKQATMTLPEGLVLNPASANRLQACSPTEIGIDPSSGIADGEPPHCPAASKIGSVEVETPLLAQYSSENEVRRDSLGRVIAVPIPGSLYIATPHDNPFGSLLAVYIALYERRHGIIVKLAGQVHADPQTGRLTATFANNPQLPFEVLKLHFFGGASAALRTPLTCGTKTTASTLTPWASPERADVTSTDSFATSGTPGGGACPSSESQAPNAPTFSAGTIVPQAGAYSPFVLKLSREDGSQPISRLDTILPPGLTGKLAGIAYCSEAALTAAANRSGDQERSSPSCSASSEVGAVTVRAGAGPAPYYTQGRAYLSGPYKGAPLSLSSVLPATAGPYDLGTVMVRSALYVDPETARIHAVSDPIPTILKGIPLDVRSVALRMDRPNFTLNPTSCDPMAITAVATSPFDSRAALTSSFQTGGCAALPFKPKLSLKLTGGTRRGAHPALKAVWNAKLGEANIAGTALALPNSEFFDLAHVAAICSRVQFAAAQCPPGSVYGHVTVITPLSDAPLSGPVYLRSSARPLPDLVADLKGQIPIALIGHIDSLRGGIRASFDAIPDAPVSKIVLSMLGGKRGLLENGRNLCKATGKAHVQMVGQNGKSHDTAPALQAGCPPGKRAAAER